MALIVLGLLVGPGGVSVFSEVGTVRRLMIVGLAMGTAVGVLLAARNQDRILAPQPAKDMADRLAEGTGATAEKAHLPAESVESGAFGLADNARSAAEALANRAGAAAEGADRVDGAVSEAAERVAAAVWESPEAAEEVVAAPEADDGAAPLHP